MWSLSRLRSFSFWQKTIRLTLLIWVLWATDADLYNSTSGLWNLLIHKVELSPQSIQSLYVVFWRGLLVLGVYLNYIYWLIHFILPINFSSPKWPAFKRIILFGINKKLHGPAIFVQNGEIIGNKEELNKKRPGIAFLDLRSAMALDCLRDNEDEENFETLPGVKLKKVHFSWFGYKAYPAQIRIVGPGLTFTEKKERITGTIDLRTQSRSRGKVFADTRDGIRVNTSVSSSFTVGQLPDILDVCMSGNQIFVIEWEKETPTGIKKIAKLKHELHPEDEIEIFDFIKNNPVPENLQSSVLQEKKPFTFDAKRVSQAIYSVTNVKEANGFIKKTWSDWPQDVTAEKFRILLSQKPLMHLYTPDDPVTYPMKKFKEDVKIAVRNSGVLAYRIVKLQNRTDLKEGELYSEEDLIFYPSQSLTRSDVLRDRGIKVNGAGFGDLEPKNEKIQQHLKESWVSSKQKEEMLRNADYDLQANRIINRARVRAQQNMNYHLAKLLEKQEYPREALAILVFQELEAAAANPETRRLLPENTLNMLSTIGELLLQSQKESDDLEGKNMIPPHNER